MLSKVQDFLNKVVEYNHGVGVASLVLYSDNSGEINYDNMSHCPCCQDEHVVLRFDNMDELINKIENTAYFVQ